MHMQGEPRTMQQRRRTATSSPRSRAFLRARAARCARAGIARERIVIDPGFGFGKTPEHNLELLRAPARTARLGLSVLVGWSRKSTLGQVTGRPVGERLAASVAAALLAVERGAAIVRVHDVRETVDALAVWKAIGSATR